MSKRQKLFIPGNRLTTIAYTADLFVQKAQEAVAAKGAFFVALSGGSTPRSLYERLFHSPYKERVAWDKVHFFWSDERSVPPDQEKSNYRMALKAGLQDLPIPPAQVHRMKAEENIEEGAKQYEELLTRLLPESAFDLVLLGMGEDGHTASLFDGSLGVKERKRLVIANWIPSLKTWRMSLTFPCIRKAALTVVLILGERKKEALSDLFKKDKKKPSYPIAQLGTPSRPALFIADQEASSLLTNADV